MHPMDRILGQTRAIDALQRQFASGRVHHAYIFHGPTGIGKFTTALAFARILLCHSPQTDLTGQKTPCGTCQSCLLLRSTSTEPAPGQNSITAAASAHPDLHILTKELAKFSDDRAIRERKLTQIPVDLLRAELIHRVYLAPQLRHGKIFIVDEAELLNPTGQNLLLKTLEEPPAGTTLVLVTSSEDRLLPTIRSRCQRIAFTPLPHEHIRQWVQRHAPSLTEQQLGWLVAFADGSLGRAELALTYGLTDWAATLLPALDRLAQGRPQGALGATVAGLIDGFAEARVGKDKKASKEAANKLAADLMCSMLATYARQRLSALAAQIDPADPGRAEAALDPWLGVIDAIRQAERFLASNVNLSLTCDYLVLAISRCLAGDRSAAPTWTAG